MQCSPKKLSNLLDICSCKNVIKSATLLFYNYVFLTDSPIMLLDTIHIDAGISDFHNLIGAIARMAMPRFKPRKIQYRFMKKFYVDNFKLDFAHFPYVSHTSLIMLTTLSELLKQLINEHAP